MSDTPIYDRAKQAVAEYRSVDSVKDLKDDQDKIMAYAKQANDYGLENDARTARDNAEKMVHKLLRMSQEDWEEYRRNLPPTQNTFL